MTPVSLLALEVLFDRAKPELISRFVEPLNAAMERFDIVTPERQAAFLPQVGIESAHLTHLAEVMNYSTPQRIVLVFRKFDLNHNGLTEDDELDFASSFILAPERLANYVYANRNGNGDEASGDGWRFRARGGLGLTGRANYAAYGEKVYRNVRVCLVNPELLEQPVDAAHSAAWFWQAHGCNELADAGDFRGITKRINGAYTGYKERSELWTVAKSILV